MMNGRIFMEWFNRAVEPYKNRIMLMLNKAVTNSVNDSQGLQTQQLEVLAGEVKRKVPVVQHYGFSSSPPTGADVVMGCINGNRENSVILGTEHRDFRFKGLAEGDSVVYNKNGKFIHLNGDDIRVLLSKLVINNDSHELIAVVSEYMERVNNGLVLTALGPMPWAPATKTLLEETKTKFDTFKE